VLLLCWGGSHEDVEVLVRLVGQLCAAYRHEGGSTLVVLSMRPKLELERVFR
jgi:hypothetical protein